MSERRIVVRRAEVRDSDAMQAIYARLELTVYTDNTAAVALYRKFRFDIEGTARGYALRNGEFVDAFMMARHAPVRVGDRASKVNG